MGRHSAEDRPDGIPASALTPAEEGVEFIDVVMAPSEVSEPLTDPTAPPLVELETRPWPAVQLPFRADLPSTAPMPVQRA